MSTELHGHSIFGVRKAGRTTALRYPSGHPRTFEATAASTAGAIVASTLASTASGNDDFVGMLVEIIEAENGFGSESGAPLRRKVKTYNHAAQTLGIEDLPFATADGDKFRLVHGGGYWSVSTAASQTSITDASRTEAADYWNGSAARGGPYMVCIAADDIGVGEQKLISNSASTGVATCAAFTDSTVVGDLFEAWQWLEVHGGLPGTFNQPRVDRPAVTGNLGTIRGVAGVRDGSVSPELAFRGPGTSGEPAELDVLLGAITTVTASPGDETIASGTTTTSVNVGSAPTAGSMFCTEDGDVCVATNAADPFTPSPTLRSAPADDTTLYGLRTYAPADALQYALDVLHYHGKGLKTEAFGCVPNLQFAGERGQFLKISAPLMVADFYTVHLDESGTAYSRPHDAIPPTVACRAVNEIRVNIGGTELEALSVSLDLGADIQPKGNLAAPNQTDGFDLRRYNVSGSVKVWLDTDAKNEIQGFLGGDPATLLIQVGNTTADPGVFAFWAYETEYTGMEITDDAGAYTVSLPFRVTADMTQTTLEDWMIGIG